MYNAATQTAIRTWTSPSRSISKERIAHTKQLLNMLWVPDLKTSPPHLSLHMTCALWHDLHDAANLSTTCIHAQAHKHTPAVSACLSFFLPSGSKSTTISPSRSVLSCGCPTFRAQELIGSAKVRSWGGYALVVSNINSQLSTIVWGTQERAICGKQARWCLQAGASYCEKQKE